MNLEELKSSGLIVLECISGSRAYGLATAQSDTDIKGVFVLPESQLLGLDYIPQISDEKNDTVYYELGRFFELLQASNPNILELLCSPKSTVLFQHSILQGLPKSNFITKQCMQTYGQFAMGQVKRARGLNKKIVNPIEAPRKSLLAFCQVLYKDKVHALHAFLEERNWQQEDCGLVKLSGMKGLYKLYYDSNASYRGLLANDGATNLSLSSVEKGVEGNAVLYFNQDAYSSYCKDYREYQQWKAARNENRYQQTMGQGKGYDAKNMMHTIRLLQTAIEIGETNEIRVERPNREELLAIKGGAFEYDELVERANVLVLRMEAVFKQSSLPLKPNKTITNQLLVDFRRQFYASPTFK